jgi:putative ABC transport system substrate-binding protein
MKKNPRRTFVIAIGAGLLAVPWTPKAHAQEKVRRVGFLSQATRPERRELDSSAAFVRGLRALGYVEGKTLHIDWRFADNAVERLPELAADLVRSNVEVIVTTSTPATYAAQKATTVIPIVMTLVADPVGSGFVKTLARPGGNVTGLTNLVSELSGKHLEMLRSVTPGLRRLAVLMDPENASNVKTLEYVRRVAPEFGISVVPFQVQTIEDIEHAFARMTTQSIQAILLSQDAVFFRYRRQIAEHVLKLRLPSIAGARIFAEAGLLLSYGPSSADIYLRAATYVDKILRGAKPTDLPVEQPTRFELVVNMKSARILRLTLPDDIMVRAEGFVE